MAGSYGKKLLGGLESSEQMCGVAMALGWTEKRHPRKTDMAIYESWEGGCYEWLCYLLFD